MFNEVGQRSDLADLRYTSTPNGFDSVWSLQLERTAVPVWHLHRNAHYLSLLASDLFHPTGYFPLANLRE